MKKTLLLCFIHGFKGGEDTFGHSSEFTEHLAALLSAALPKINVRSITYPKYETRGDLYECVGRFRDWLLEKVIDLEVAAGTPSPTVDPSVRVVLIGHSMGGIIAAETAIALASDRPIKESEGGASPEPSVVNGLMFPYIQGVLAFDTPYLGISPGVVAHGAEGHYNNASALLSQLGGLSAVWGGSKAAEDAAVKSVGKKPVAALEAPPAADKRDDKGGWGSWGKIAMIAGTAGAIAAGGAAAYMKKDQITEGWSWVSSHLAFVGCLAKGQELKNRINNMMRLNHELDVGFAVIYTRLGKAASSKEVSMVGTVMGNQRTFCNLPNKQTAGEWKEAVNDSAKDEIGAHMAMFESSENPGYQPLSEDAKDFITKWAKNEWYESSSMEIEEPLMDWDEAKSDGRDAPMDRQEAFSA
ncbi:uncharacterized protein BCR38DRAFT_63398 [Pseudomassariella vexata]|uniref:AB hydrolase-1 domain-containing protein n=1 Tax=Pseudomassariella vexata TaxID=1141098 RepID=A0A1Y2DIK5_9PEZI|nr:uncharacterized protein BCR38DRAFT_63398 [Pseudomassariella vexata]ORY59058.1 hypothetical protein BCR38DRAFT_63398 [Pseudomassariella vexata]